MTTTRTSHAKPFFNRTNRAGTKKHTRRPVQNKIAKVIAVAKQETRRPANLATHNRDPAIVSASDPPPAVDLNSPTPVEISLPCSCHALTILRLLPARPQPVQPKGIIFYTDEYGNEASIEVVYDANREEYAELDGPSLDALVPRTALDDEYRILYPPVDYARLHTWQLSFSGLGWPVHVYTRLARDNEQPGSVIYFPLKSEL
uniref:Uncharacterized protein n=1 Tax=Mycena chlorophos TaxID=658473 RepID=A0ABQ0LW42_MYCCL|nr:predicted protein [Mycena chlorophos]